MNKKRKRILLFLMMVFLLSGLTGCSTSTDYFPVEATSSLGSIRYGSLFFNLPESCRSIPGNDWGVIIGKICVVLFSMMGLGMALDELDGCLSAIVSFIRDLFTWLLLVILVLIIQGIVKCSGCS